MFGLRPAPGAPGNPMPSTWMAWDKIGTVVAGSLLLVAGGTFLPDITTRFGWFPTLFVAAVIVASVVMHLRDQSTPHQPQT